MTIAKLALHTFTQTCGFSRLKNMFRHGINYNDYSRIVSSASNKTIGNIPQNLLEIIIINNPTTKKEAILRAQKAFEDANIELSAIDKAQQQLINRTPVTLENFYRYITNLDNGKNTISDKIFENKITEILCKAEGAMYKKLSPIIPNLHNIKMEPIGNGAYSNIFKCQLFDKNGEKIIEDLVIKSYRQGSTTTDMQVQKLFKMLDTYSNEELMKYANANNLKISISNIQSLRDVAKVAKTAKSTKNENRYLDAMHGAFAEANASEYIKYMTGHKVTEKNGLVIPYMFNLGKNPFCVSKFIDSNIHQANQIYKFERLGLQHTDLWVNPANTINNICVDMGGIRGCFDNQKLNYYAKLEKETGIIDFFGLIDSSKSTIVGDKEATRILKEVQNLKSTETVLAYLKSIETRIATTKNELERRMLKETLAELKTKGLIPKFDYRNTTTELIDETTLDKTIREALDINS